MITAVDLCCGAGGWAVAARGLPIRFVAVADREPDALETWRVNHAGQHPKCKMIECDLSTPEGRAEVLAAAPRADLTLGGIPCEEVSLARGSTPLKPGEMDTWLALIDNCFGIVRDTGSRYWCFEDVIQIETYLPAPLLTGHPFRCRRIEAKDYGPQDRLRTFIGDFPEPARPEPGPRTLADVLRRGPYQTEPDAESYTVNEQGGRDSMFLGSHSIRLLNPAMASPTIIGSTNRGSRQRRAFMLRMPDGRLRNLSWQEAAALQGFPDDYVFAAQLCRTIKMIGQAIPIPVGRAILQGIVAEAQKGKRRKRGIPIATENQAAS